MANNLLVMILILAALAAILSGMGVFSNSRPPDARLNQVLEDLDDVKGVLNTLQKSIMQLERKADKDQKDARAELKDTVDRAMDRIEKRIQELG